MIKTYDIVSATSVGPFKLGDSLYHILGILRARTVEYPKVELAWDPENALKSAVTIHLPHLDLYFPASGHQTLTLILISLITTLDLTYKSQPLSGGSSVDRLTRSKVGKVLGPTYAGESNSSLKFPGIEFELATSGAAGRDDLVEKIKVLPRTGEEEVILNPLVSCEIKPGKGVTLFTPDPLDIILGQTTAVDLVADLGSPPGKHWKRDDRLARMWGVANSVDLAEGYRFWNYFEYGLDFLLDPFGVVIKVITHSNIPGTPLFQRYARCPWVLPSTGGDLVYDSPASAFRSNLLAKAHAYVDEVRLTVPESTDRPASPGSNSSKGSGSGKKQSRKKGKAELIEWKEDAMVLDRLSEFGYEGINGASPSRLIGFDGVVIEEDQASGGICAVLVWMEDPV